MPAQAERSKKSRDALSASFYPEGGNLVRGLTSRVAFKLIDADGLTRSSDIASDCGLKKCSSLTFGNSPAY